MKRRQFIKSGAGIALTAGAAFLGHRYGRTAASAAVMTKRELPIPKLLEFNDSPIELSMDNGSWEILPGIKTPTRGFNGPILGPTLRVRDGQDVPITYRNRLAEPVAIHAHGLHIPGELDGGPQRQIEPESHWSLELPIRQQACTSWYHPHTHGRTGAQTYSGLAGMIIIDDENSDSLPLPRNYGIDDIPLVVQDRTIDYRGQLDYSLEDAEDGFMGETLVVNGIANAKKSVPAGLVRLRVLNGSNARYYRFGFSDNRVFHSIATDGGFLQEPVPLREIILLPGERSELLVDFSDGRAVSLVSGRYGRSPTGSDRRRGERRNDREPGGMAETFEILEISVDTRLPAHRTALPRQLNNIARPTLSSDWPVRRFSLFMEGDRRRRGLFGDQRRNHSEMKMGINGQPVNIRVINERVKRWQWERWIVQSYDGSHPFHVHGCSFLVLAQEGRPVADENAGWKDTVRVDDTAEFIVKFDHGATEEYPYMYHCHILEHEDRGMMGQFTVT